MRLVDCSVEVREALAAARAVVALESSVVAHGLPYPHNLETASALGEAVRSAGAVPAMVGVVDGRLRVGLDGDELERMATTPRVAKVGNRDLGVVLARGGLGATTVASTMAVAELAGITVVCSGGLGGVHRGAPESFDISADLLQLTRSRVLVTSAGVKSVLDIGLTLEHLETHGVPVIGFCCDEFPAYYCRTSGYRVPQRLDSVEEVVAAAGLHWAAGLTGSVLVVTPIDEQDALDSAEMEEVIGAALGTARDEGITGPGVTPYLMKAVSAATGGRTAEANRAVLLGSARLAGRIASAWAARAAR